MKSLLYQNILHLNGRHDGIIQIYVKDGKTFVLFPNMTEPAIVIEKHGLDIRISLGTPGSNTATIEAVRELPC